MKHQPILAFPESAPGMTRRALAKQRTRQRLLGAARRLFTSRGYDAATIRDIASEADLSTGAVFASFSDKAELFNEVIVADCEAHYARAKAAGAEIIDDYEVKEYGGAGYSCRDLEGHLWWFGSYDPWAAHGGT